jgi:RHS repeat-associated protein
MIEDHQGGVSNIASKSGASDVNESFSAFGTRRNPTSWSGAPTTADLNTIAGLSRQGYTFQTWLGQSMGLNHMNGRVQDAILGRFLSADPHIPDPSNAQSYNRYTYVNNNPVTATDPTGFRSRNQCIDTCPPIGTSSIFGRRFFNGDIGGYQLMSLANSYVGSVEGFSGTDWDGSSDDGSTLPAWGPDVAPPDNSVYILANGRPTTPGGNNIYVGDDSDENSAAAAEKAVNAVGAAVQYVFNQLGDVASAIEAPADFIASGVDASGLPKTFTNTVDAINSAIQFFANAGDANTAAQNGDTSGLLNAVGNQLGSTAVSVVLSEIPGAGFAYSTYGFINYVNRSLTNYFNNFTTNFLQNLYNQWGGSQGPPQ